MNDCDKKKETEHLEKLMLIVINSQFVLHFLIHHSIPRLLSDRSAQAISVQRRRTELREDSWDGEGEKGEEWLARGGSVGADEVEGRASQRGDCWGRRGGVKG